MKSVVSKAACDFQKRGPGTGIVICSRGSWFGVVSYCAASTKGVD
jgi:hypothetical protein